MGSPVCFLLYCRDVVALLTPGGAIPARRYTFSTAVMERHAAFRAGSCLLTCFDLFHTGRAYSAVEWQSARAVVLMVACLAPYFVFDSVPRILFRADVLYFVCVCALCNSVFYPRSLPDIQG